MNMINKEPERHEIEALLPWHAAGTLNRRDADRVEQALAGDRELARRYDLVREELAETIHLNETLGAPSARAMEKLFAAIDAEEARAPRRQRSFDLAGRISEFLSGFTPRTLAWSATAAAVAIVVQAAVITTVVVKEHGAPGGIEPGRARRLDGSYAVVRFAPQATFSRHHQFPRCPQGHAGRGTGRRAASTAFALRDQAERGRGRQDHPADAVRIEDRWLRRGGAAATIVGKIAGECRSSPGS